MSEAVHDNDKPEECSTCRVLLQQCADILATVGEAHPQVLTPWEDCPECLAVYDLGMFCERHRPKDGGV